MFRSIAHARRVHSTIRGYMKLQKEKLKYKSIFSHSNICSAVPAIFPREHHTLAAVRYIVCVCVCQRDDEL